jgi:nucleoside-diphosphate-sugar epimerase
MNTVVVTGANGFIGRHLCRHLLHQGVPVVACVRSRESVSLLPEGSRPVVTGAIESYDRWETLLDGTQAIVHLASRAHVLKETTTNPLDAFRAVNVAGTERILDACQQSAPSVTRFVYVSSIGAVGHGADHPYHETDECRPEEPYGISKHEAERLVFGRSAAMGLQAVAVRPPLVYGVGARGNFPRLLQAVRRGQMLPLGGIRNKRSFLYVGNLVSAIQACLFHSAAAGQVFHVADSDVISTARFLELIARACRRPARLLPVPVPVLKTIGFLAGRSKDIKRLVADLTVSTEKIRTTLAWSPAFSTEEGIRHSVPAEADQA